MPLTVTGNDITFTGDVRVVNGFNPDTGVAYLILTPAGGVGALPFMAQGLPGLSPVFDSMTLIEVLSTDPLPTPNPVVTQVSPGGAGTASHYTLVFYIHKGATGATGSPSIAGSSDISGTPTDKYMLAYRSSDSKWVITAQKIGDLYIPSAITSKAFNNTSPHLIASVNILAQPYDWRPICHGQSIITGSADTRIDLVARLDDAAAGNTVGYSYGLAGTAPPPNILIPTSPVGSAVPGAYGRVTAGNAATVYFRAEQKAASSNSWSLSNTSTTFAVQVHPLL
jgi:hypothetical protein